MKLTVKFIYISLILLSVACKKKQPGARTAEEAKGDQPIANAFAIKSAIAIYDAPELRAKAIGTLPIGTRVDIFASHVPDKKEPDKSFWYKVRYSPAGAAADKPVMPVEGFVSEREEVLRQNFLIFKAKGEESVWDETTQQHKKVTGPFGVMAMTSVRLRKSPALNGQLVRTLNNGEVVTVQEVSTSQVEIDKKRAEWYFVKDSEGISGYAFGGYLVSGLESELKGLQNLGFRFTRGWIRIMADGVNPLASPQGNDVMDFTNTAGTSAVDGKGALPKNAFLLVDAEVTKDPEKRYRAIIRTQQEERYFVETKFYVPTAKVKFVRDYYTVSKTIPHNIDPALAEELNAYVGGDLNLQCTKITPFETQGSAPRKFISAEIATGYVDNASDGKPNCYDAIELSSLLIEQKDGKNIFLGRIDETGAVFDDLDGDGIPELVSEHSHPRGGYALSIFSLKNGKLQPLFSWSGDRAGSCLRMEFKDNQIVIDYDSYYAEKMKEGEQFEHCKINATEFSQRFGDLPVSGKEEVIPYHAKLQNGKLVAVD